MRPLNTHRGGRGSSRRGPEAAARALLCAVLLLGCAEASRAQGAAVAGVTSALREKDVRRAEKVSAKLRLLDAAAAARDAGEFRRLAGKFFPGLFVTVADMRQSDLKTDLDTAVYLYGEAARAWAAAWNSAVDCGRERPDLYLPLCLDLGGGTARQLLIAKARLHARWAEAVVKTYRGEGDAGTARLLSEMKAARAHDALLAARVSDALRALEEMVEAPPTFADYQEQRAAAKVSFEKLEAEFADTLGRAGALLAWMPRSPAFYYLSSARRGYKDGLFWYRKVDGSRRMVVSAVAGEPDTLKDLRLDPEQVGYIAAMNWRAAAKHTRLANQSPPGMPR